MSDLVIVLPPPAPTVQQPIIPSDTPPAMSERSASKARSVAPVSSSSKRSTHEAATGTTTTATADNTAATIEAIPETSGEKADEDDVMQVDDVAAEPAPATDVTAGVAGASVTGEQDELEAADEEAPANGQTAAAAATVDGEEDDDIQIFENQDDGKNGKSVDGDDGDDAESGLDEGEYEIESILDNKRLTGKGKSGFEYLVSWVGYGPEFNEWVGEENFGSHEMIDNYWSKLGGKPNNKGPQKRGATSATGSKRRRAEDSPTANGAGPSKRGRRNNAVPAVTDQEEDPEADELSAFSKDHKDSMAPYADYASWEEHVRSIETIERGANDKLVVYMIMKGGEKTAQDAETCNGRCPQKMLKFYERHLKWRQTK